MKVPHTEVATQRCLKCRREIASDTVRKEQVFLNGIICLDCLSRHMGWGEYSYSAMRKKGLL